MMRSAGCKLIMPALALVACLQAAPVAQAQSATPSAAQQSVLIRVRDAASEAALALDKRSLRLEVGGKPKVIEKIEWVTQEPIVWVFLFDFSKSRAGAPLREEFRAAETLFRSAMRPGDSAFAALFNSGVSVASPLSGDPATLERNLRAAEVVQPSSHTSLYDTIDWALNTKLRDIAGRRLVFIFSDGEDNGSQLTHEQARCPVLSAEAILYLVDDAAADGLRKTSKGTSFSRRTFKLVEDSGGQHLFVRQPTDLPAAMETLRQAAMLPAARIYFQPASPLKQGKPAKLKLTVENRTATLLGPRYVCSGP